MVHEHHHYYFIPIVFPFLYPMFFSPTVYLQLVSFLACTFCFSTKKIQANTHLTWFIENYPRSAKQTKENQDSKDFWNQFK